MQLIKLVWSPVVLVSTGPQIPTTTTFDFSKDALPPELL